MNWIHEKAEWPFYCRRQNSLSEELIRSQFWESCVVQSFFIGVWKFVKLWKIQIKQGYSVTIFSFSEEKKIFKFWKNKKLNFFWSHLDSDFNLLTFLRLVFKLFRWVLKTCCYLMLNPSQDASQWWAVTKLKNITSVVVQSKEEDLSCKLRVDARNLGL
jgi:hypothetical protein